MNTRQTLNLIRAHESRNVTFLDPDGSWPIVWRRARGVHVQDADGRKYLDLTAAFGVAAAGHANPRVVCAGQRQMTELLHAMGDVHPHALKARLARELSRITFERWGSRRTPGKVIFCNSGFEAVEAALKTAALATKRRTIIAFEGAYHGLGYGALNATHRDHFRSPFLSQLGGFGVFAPFPSRPEDLPGLEKILEKILRKQPAGAILVEPVQARGGIRIPPPGFLPLLRRLCDKHQSLLVLDEIYTGFGRTGKWFACEHSGVTPDLVCLGKALTGGFPLSACVGRAAVMDAAWPPSDGEAIHTSTFLGHPVGCAMALAQIAEIRRLKLPLRSARLGRRLLDLCTGIHAPHGTHIEARGIGLMAGIELRDRAGRPDTGTALRVMKTMLRMGFILLPEGEHSNILSFTPPLTITEAQLKAAVHALKEALS
jgi:4-aminobutyrate aminotransferase-like enzyme